MNNQLLGFPRHLNEIPGLGSNYIDIPIQIPLSTVVASDQIGIPSDSSEPWSHLGVPDNQQILADQLVFAPDSGQYPGRNFFRGHLPDLGHAEDAMGSNLKTSQNQTGLQSSHASLKNSVEEHVRSSSLTVTSPAHKAKKPQKIKGKGGRRKGLSPQRRERIDQMRKQGACWHCKVMRYPV